MVLGESGIFKKANDAKEKTVEAQAEEEINLKILETQAENDGKFSYSKFLEKLNNSGDTYVITDEFGNTLLEIPDNYEGKINIVNEKYGIKVGVTEDLKTVAEGKEEEETGPFCDTEFTYPTGEIVQTSIDLNTNDFTAYKVFTATGKQIDDWYYAVILTNGDSNYTGICLNYGTTINLFNFNGSNNNQNVSELLKTVNVVCLRKEGNNWSCFVNGTLSNSSTINSNSIRQLSFGQYDSNFRKSEEPTYYIGYNTRAQTDSEITNISNKLLKKYK